MKNFVRIVAIFFLLALVACQEAPASEVAEATAVVTEAVTETAVAPTNTTEPTEVPTETATAAPTETESPTPSPTDTPEPTVTNTATPTEEPPTETPTSVPTATNTAAATAVPATATTAPPPAAAPPPAPAPSGPNMLGNAGFEFGADLWNKPGGGSNMSFYIAGSQPQFVHSGQQSLLLISPSRVWQQVSTGITAGTTYRAGGWLKIWSSTQEDRTVSVSPADYVGRICINTNGDDDPNLTTTICSSWVRPLDVWQFISVDAVATNDRISVILQTGLSNGQGGMHNEAMWDDITMGLAPVAATATPSAAGPVRPNPIAFNATALRDSMNSVRLTIEQAGGLLDRLYNGEPGRCEEYQGYYDDGIRSTTYSGVPEDWAGIYNDYIFAVENFLATNESINALCDDGGGVISALNYGAARQGINNSLDRLIPAIEAANAKLGG